jgi:hypothetical protein
MNGWHSSLRDSCVIQGRSRQRRPAARELAICAFAALVAGCSGGDGAVEVAPVTGTVRFKGVPVAGAWVQFTQADAPIGAGGYTDDAGKFELTSYREGDGAPLGDNQVAISVPEHPPEDLEEFKAGLEEIKKIEDIRERHEKMAELTRARRQRSPDAVKPRLQLPKKYASAKSSGLSFTVEAGKQNECEFDLED